MKTYLAAVACVGAVAAMLAAGGCVSKADYDKALNMNRKANEQLALTQEQLRMAEAQKAELAAKLAERDATLAAKLQEIALLEAKCRDLQAALDKLNALSEGAKEPKAPALIALPPALDEALRAFALANPDLVEYNPALGMVKFKSDLTFDKGSDEVTPGASEALGKLVGILNGSAATRFYVYVAGHTDDIPIEKPETKRRHPTNWYLSVHRSVEVEKVLGAAGLAPERIGLMGFSEYHPVAANAPGKQGNAKNRRVEIWIVPPGRFLTESGAAAATAG